MGPDSIPRLIEFPVPGVHDLSGITTGPDKTLWFTTDNEHYAQMVGRVKTNGDVTLYNNFPSTGPFPGLQTETHTDITPGPNGNLWFTTGFASQIIKITPGGAGHELSPFSAVLDRRDHGCL
jgi:hypothetical protein